MHHPKENTEMLDSLSRIPLPPQQKRIGSLRCPQSQLIQSNHLTATLLNPLTSGLCNPQCGNAQFGNFQHSHIISDGPNDNDSFIGVFLGMCNLTTDKADRHRWAIDTGLEETFEDCLIELGIRTTGEETVEFYQEEEVNVF